MHVTSVSPIIGDCHPCSRVGVAPDPTRVSDIAPSREWRVVEPQRRVASIGTLGISAYVDTYAALPSGRELTGRPLAAPVLWVRLVKNVEVVETRLALHDRTELGEALMSGITLGVPHRVFV